jgi:hypothetical protein
VADVSEFMANVFRKSRLFLNDEAGDWQSGAAKSNYHTSVQSKRKHAFFL